METSATKRAGAPSSARDTDAGEVGGALPTAIIIGAQKCGTSGLHYYLGLHPEVSISDPKELNFFIAERNWPRGVDWYKGRFDARYPVRVEASPNYTAYPQHKGVPERMAEVVPGARLIFLVRDPIDRIAAHWVHNYSKGRHTGALTETITRPKTSYIDRSRYAMQLERFLAVYPRDQLLVLEQDDLRRRRDETLCQVFEFVGADPAFTDRRFSEERHKTARKTRPTALGRRLDERRARSRRPLLPEQAWAVARTFWPLGARIERPQQMAAAIPPDVMALLRADAERLREITGREFERWSIWDQ